jgi:uncharacterized protein involved in type VI secretion and phage assembly
MPDSLVEVAAQLSNPTDRRVYGVALAQVVDNVDTTGKARVQVRLPWLPGVEPWARLAVLSAGNGRGTYFVPQVGDEVLVAFNQGDVREPFVVGSLWSSADPPPTQQSTDAISKRIVRTPVGHEILLDDTAGKVSVSTKAGQKVTLDTKGITLELPGGDTKLSLKADGSIALEASLEITLKAPTVKLEGQAINLDGTAIDVAADASCSISGGTVRLN